MKAISFIEKLSFRPCLLCSKPVKPGHYSVLPSHILCVLLTKYGKMTQSWNNNIHYLIIFHAKTVTRMARTLARMNRMACTLARVARWLTH